MDVFPPVVHAFGYGSGVLEQGGNIGNHGNNNNNNNSSSSSTMVDIILVVDNAQTWHAQNLQRHSHHYALVSKLGKSQWCAWIQNIPPGIYFHPGIVLQDTFVKYGVVETRRLKEDLRDWKYLYLAGRLHKPTLTIVEKDDEITTLQCQHNLPAALAASLLLLNSADESLQQKHALTTVYQQIAQLSYSGDFRVRVGAEDPHKIAKLVHSAGQLERWNDLYQTSINDLETSGILSVTEDGSHVEYNVHECRDDLKTKLPFSLQQYTADKDSLQVALNAIVAPAARTQSIKGIVTAGIVRSTQYAFAKLSKGILKR